MPAQLTTASHAIGPSAVSTPVTTPSRTATARTATSSRMTAPPARAPAASAWVTSAGMTRPSSGISMAPARSSVRQSGQCRVTSPVPIVCASMSTARDSATLRRSWVRRSGVRATIRLPQRRQPVSNPVSAGRRA